MIELYHNDMSVCAQKVRFALGEKTLQWKNRHLNLRAGNIEAGREALRVAIGLSTDHAVRQHLRRHLG